MNWREVLDGFQFDNQPVIDIDAKRWARQLAEGQSSGVLRPKAEEIDAGVTDHLTLVVHLYGRLARKRDAAQRELYAHGLFVDAFEKARAKRSMHFDGGIEHVGGETIDLGARLEPRLGGAWRGVVHHCRISVLIGKNVREVAVCDSVRLLPCAKR